VEWKRLINRAIDGGFDSRRHPIYIETAAINAQNNFQMNATDLLCGKGFYLVCIQFINETLKIIGSFAARVTAIKWSGRHLPNFEKNAGEVFSSSFFKNRLVLSADLCFRSEMNAISGSTFTSKPESKGLMMTDL
jgi:hypothetical protein